MISKTEGIQMGRQSWFTAFYSEEDRGVSLSGYVSMMLIGQQVLAATNPQFKYVVLTDLYTAAKLPPELAYEVVADKCLPLMQRSMEAQKRFLERVGADDYVVLAAPDCLASGKLENAIGGKVDIGLTWRMNQYPINNVAYIRNPRAGAWYLGRALEKLEQLPEENKHWWGDMRAWELALGPWRHLLWGDDGYYKCGKRMMYPGGYLIVAYPCATHNYAIPKGKLPKKLNESAFLIHFKGVRKKKMLRYANRHILHIEDEAEQEDFLAEKKPPELIDSGVVDYN